MMDQEPAAYLKTMQIPDIQQPEVKPAPPRDAVAWMDMYGHGSIKRTAGGLEVSAMVGAKQSLEELIGMLQWQLERWDR